MLNLSDLLSREEGSKCDFKRKFYALPEQRAELAKDISALANSTRKHEGDSYLIVGYSRGDCRFFDVDPRSIGGEAAIQETVNSIITPPVHFTM